MCDPDRQLAATLHRVCRFALTRGMTADERREIEAALALAAEARDGNPVEDLRQAVREAGHRIYPAGLRVDAVADLLGVTAGCLANWRCYRDGPPYTRIGGKIYYPLDGLATFIRYHRAASRSGFYLGGDDHSPEGY